MTLREAIEIADKMVVNDFDYPTKTAWINEIETKIQSEVFELAPNNAASYVWESEYAGNIIASGNTITMAHPIDARNYGELILSDCDIAGTYTVKKVDGNELTVKETLTDYTGSAKLVFTNKDTELLLNNEWGKLYYKWLIAKVDFANRDYDLYADTSEYFNSDWADYVKWYCYHFIDNRRRCYVQRRDSCR